MPSWKPRARTRWSLSQAIDVFAPAKVNLALHVIGQRADGYHLLDSLVAFADLGDRLRLTPGPRLSMQISGPFAAGVPADRRNLVWQAAEAAGWTGHIALEKGLPHGAGIGGGSSDAAAVLNALGAAHGGLHLGADVPVCRLARAARMRGIGEWIEPVRLPALAAVLVNPGARVPTAAVFSGLATKNNPPLDPMPADGGWRDWLAAQRNDLEAPAAAVCPDVRRVLGALAQTDGWFARMSGSGATCFAIFDDAQTAKHQAQRLSEDQPGWWVRACRLS